VSRKIDPAKHDAILQAARELIKVKGIQDITISAIAAKAGIATGTVYLYFKSKSEIIDGLCDYYLLDHLKAISPEMEEPNVRIAIAKTVHAALEHSSKNADLVRLIDLRRSTGGKTNMPKADRVVQRELRTWISTHINDGTLIQYNPVILAELIGGMVEWISKICYVWWDIEPARYESTLIEMLDHALINNPEFSKPEFLKP
jgi:AcrR family transcriptional regulator